MFWLLQVHYYKKRFWIFSGTDGGLDFGTIKVMDEVKQTCTLKNKGKYDIAFK